MDPGASFDGMYTVSDVLAQDLAAANAIYRMLSDEAFGHRWFYATPCERRNLILKTIQQAREEPAACQGEADQEFPDDETAWTYERVYDLVRKASADKFQFVHQMQATGVPPQKAFEQLIEKIRETAQADVA